MWAWPGKDEGRRGEEADNDGDEGGFRLFCFPFFALLPSSLSISFRARGGSWDVLS